MDNNFSLGVSFIGAFDNILKIDNNKTNKIIQEPILLSISKKRKRTYDDNKNSKSNKK